MATPQGSSSPVSSTIPLVNNRPSPGATAQVPSITQSAATAVASTPSTLANDVASSSTVSSVATPAPDANRSSISITQSSIIPTPQTVPADPTTWDPSSDIGGASDSADPRSLPVVAVAVIGVVAGLTGLIILFQVYRRVSSRLLRRFNLNRHSSVPPPLPDSAAPAPKFLSSTLRGSPSAAGRPNYFPTNVPNGAYNSQAYPNTYRYTHLTDCMSSEQLSSIGIIGRASPGSANPPSEKHEGGSSSSESFPSHDNERLSPKGQLAQHILSAKLASDDGRALLPLPPTSRTSSPSSVPGLNPLLTTRDHSTLSTNTLKNASRHQSLYASQSHRFSVFDGHSALSAGSGSGSSTSLPPLPNHITGGRRLSSGLPHLTRSRIGLTLPPPLAHAVTNPASSDSSTSNSGWSNGGSDSTSDLYRDPARRNTRSISSAMTPGSHMPWQDPAHPYPRSGPDLTPDRYGEIGHGSHRSAGPSSYGVQPLPSHASWPHHDRNPDPDSASPLDLLQIKFAKDSDRI